MATTNFQIEDKQAHPATSQQPARAIAFASASALVERASMRFDLALKRGLDIVVAAAGLLLLFPLILMTCLVVKAYDRGPVLYRALRCGRGGRVFRLFKFRTMVADADKLGPGITAGEDSRITPLGQWLRATKLDELPQLINVLRGEMSLVGPRPEDPAYVALYTPEQRRALDARPGITSAASLGYRHEQQMLSGPDWEAVYANEVMPAKLAIDLAYLSRRTIWSDIGLIIRTGTSMFDIGGLAQKVAGAFIGLRNRHFFLADVLVLLITPTIALALRTDGTEIALHPRSLVLVTLVSTLITLVVFVKGGLYSRFWRFAGVEELSSIAGLTLLATCFQAAAYLLIMSPQGWVSNDFPRSLPLINGLLVGAAVGALRYSVRLADRSRGIFLSGPGATRVLVVGAGTAGLMMVDELRRNPQLHMTPVGFVDDDPTKQGASIRGLYVMGRCSDIARVAREAYARSVVIAMPAASGKVIRQVVSTCEQAGLKTKTVPGMYELIGGRVSIKQLRDVRIEDLLRREPVCSDLAAVSELVRGKRVLVTGGGGSIGSEICRQVLRFEPAELVILGHGENSVFEIHSELSADLARSGLGEGGHGPRLHAVIADVRDAGHIRLVFEEHKPQVIFHAAAHKHVPLMEAHPGEAVTNNISGIRNLLDSSRSNGVEHFVMISTDKAVRPKGIMGASKRVAELLVQQAAVLSGHPYVAVRFGNVLGSRGSAVPIFQRQIAAGGPVTITHPDMVRYFMTIPEAVQLVLQAATLGLGGEVFMLDMGDPVKIVDLARDLIELSGYEVGRDIDIVYTGVRPGEKLAEELCLDDEIYKHTRHEKIRALINSSYLVPAPLNSLVEQLESAAQCGDRLAIFSSLQALIPEFSPASPPPGWSVATRATQAQRASIITGILRTGTNGTIEVAASALLQAPGVNRSGNGSGLSG